MVFRLADDSNCADAIQGGVYCICGGRGSGLIDENVTGLSYVMWSGEMLKEHVVCRALNIKITNANGMSFVIRIQINNKSLRSSTK